MTTYSVCFCFRREFRPASIDPPEHIKELFDRYSEGGSMRAEHLQRFLAEVQGEGVVGTEAAQGIVERHRHHHLHHPKVFHRKGNDGLSLDGFFRFLFSEDNLALHPARRVYQDMHAPLSHYFIYTGHNSYLTGNQLSSACSDVPIIEALKRGVRVIELDMWPNSTKDNVDILHGRTLTTPVTLIKCLRSIKEHAFSASPYPVILTLEDHLTPNLQTKAAEMINNTFEEMLYIPDKEFLEQFPSPEELKMKIIISTKPPKEYLETQASKGNNSILPVKDSVEDDAWGSELPDLQTKMGIENKPDQIEGFQGEDDFEDRDQKSSQKVAPEYKRLIAITVKKRRGIEESFRNDPQKVTRLSVSEELLEKAALSHGTEIVRFTQRNLLRIFPKNTRIMSTNYNPLIGWMHGAQMVAFNMQGHGRPLWLMHGMFRANGGCGYVKKPDILLKNETDDQIFNPKAIQLVKKTLKVRVYMGDGWRFDFHHRHFDTYSPPDFYTRVGIAGVPADAVMRKTRTIEDNWAPVWDEEFTFPLTVPELALLRIEVHEYDLSEKDDFAGQNCLPISELQVGIRAVPLFDQKGEQLRSVKLLMHLEFI